MGYARAHGGNCAFPAGDFKTTRTIQITAQKPTGKNFADVSIVGMVGSGHASAIGSVATAGNSTYAFGTRIIYAVKNAPSRHRPIRPASYLTVYISNIAFVGPDEAQSGAVSGDAIKVHGGAEPRMIINDVAVGGFYGSGTWALDIDGAEGSEFRNLLCQGNNGCMRGFDAFNGNTFTNVSSSRTTDQPRFSSKVSTP